MPHDCRAFGRYDKSPVKQLLAISCHASALSPVTRPLKWHDGMTFITARYDVAVKHIYIQLQHNTIRSQEDATFIVDGYDTICCYGHRYICHARSIIIPFPAKYILMLTHRLSA